MSSSSVSSCSVILQQCLADLCLGAVLLIRLTVMKLRVEIAVFSRESTCLAGLCLAVL